MTPTEIVEAKRHNRAIDAGIAGATIALVQDVGAIPTVLVATSGFSVAAKNHLEAEEIGHLTITPARPPTVRSLKNFCAKSIMATW
jgi:hypothetical protein